MHDDRQEKHDEYLILGDSQMGNKNKIRPVGNEFQEFLLATYKSAS